MPALRLLTLLILLHAPAIAGAADDRVWMSEAAIRAELTNRKLAGQYPNGIRWSEVIHTDGTTDYEEAGIRSRGRWTLSGSVFCFKYDTPLAGGCFRMIKVGSNCYELYVERNFLEPPPVSRDREQVAWNGRMWRAAEKDTCSNEVS